MRVNLCFQMIVYQSDYVLEEALRSVLQFGPAIVTEGPCGYWAQIGAKTSTDNTNDILASDLGTPYCIIGVERGQWSEKDEMVNASLHMVPTDTTHLFVVDADEVWREQDLQHIVDLIEERELDSMGFTADSFFGGFDYILTGFERNFEVIRVQRWYDGALWATHRPPTIVDGLGRPWRTRRHMSHQATYGLGITMPHYSYVFPKQVFAKHDYYSHYAQGITIPDYPTEVYLPWVEASPSEKLQIEAQWQGIHNFVPSYRGDCYSALFTGSHPEQIQKSLPRLQERFEKELVWARNQRRKST